MSDSSDPKGVEQRSTILQFLWIGFYSAILTVLTLGIFSFWARTQMRRQMWKDTALEGEPLEYTGKGSELFFGFILAVIVLGAGGAILVGVPMGLSAVDPTLGLAVGVVAGLIYLAALIVLPGAATLLARRYLMSRTTWRGVRFEQGGHPIGFGLKYFVQSLLTLITLGIYAPIAQFRIAEMFWGSAKFGSLSFQFDAQPQSRTEAVWPSFWVAYLANLVGVGVMVAVAFASGLYDPEISADPMGMLQALGVFYAAVFVVLLFVILAASWHAAVMIRQVIKLVSIGEARFNSNLGTWPLLWLLFTNVLLVVFTLGFGAMAAQMRLWRIMARSMSIEGALDYAAIQQSASRGPTTGEGLATALDISGGF